MEHSIELIEDADPVLAMEDAANALVIAQVARDDDSATFAIVQIALCIAPAENDATLLTILPVAADNSAFVLVPAVADAPAEVEAATTALAIAHAEAAADALTIEHAVEAATVLAATAHAIAPIEEAAPRSVRAIGLLEAVPALADTVSVLALESIQNTDPVITYSLAVESANELHIKVDQTTRGGCFCSVQHHTCGGGFYCSRFKSIADLWTKLFGLDLFCRLQE